MKKTALTVFVLMITTNNQLFSADYYEYNNKERPKHRHKRTPSEIQFPMIPLEQFVTSFLPAKDTVFEQLKDRPSMQALLAKVPVEDFFSHIQKTSAKSSRHALELKKTEEIYHFLAAAKIELKLEAPDINELATKYKFIPSILIKNAAIYGISNFDRHFLKTPPPTAASTPAMSLRQAESGPKTINAALNTTHSCLLGLAKI